MLNFERIEQNWSWGEGNNKTPIFYIYRAKIPNGWLVVMAQREMLGDCGWGYGGTTFVPDPNHQWDGSSLQ